LTALEAGMKLSVLYRMSENGKLGDVEIERRSVRVRITNTTPAYSGYNQKLGTTSWSKKVFQYWAKLKKVALPNV